MKEVDVTFESVKANFEKLKMILRSCEAENLVLRELLKEAIGGLCDGCSGREPESERCKSCKWASIRNGEIT